jgi:hypothetical protein
MTIDPALCTAASRFPTQCAHPRIQTQAIFLKSHLDWSFPLMATWWYGATPMPMLLHVFEHIAREAILNWINSLPDSESAMPQPPP